MVGGTAGQLTAGAIAAPFAYMAVKKKLPQGTGLKQFLKSSNSEEFRQMSREASKYLVPSSLAGGLIGGTYGAGRGALGKLERDGHLNKEAAMANLLEQGYSVEAALGMLS